jgi:hypothetical protein
VVRLSIGLFLESLNSVCKKLVAKKMGIYISSISIKPSLAMFGCIIIYSQGTYYLAWAAMWMFDDEWHEEWADDDWADDDWEDHDWGGDTKRFWFEQMWWWCSRWTNATWAGKDNCFCEKWVNNITNLTKIANCTCSAWNVTDNCTGWQVVM